MWNYALIEKPRRRSTPKTASFISIGPAGEMKLTGASVACTDQDKDRRPGAPRGPRRPRRGDGQQGPQVRGGRPGKASGVRQPADRKAFAALCKTYTKEYLEGPQMFKTAPARSCRWPTCSTPSRTRTAPRASRPTRDARRQAHRRELRDARRRHAQLHDGLHRAVQQHRPRRRGQLQDVRPRVRDAHAARRELRHRELGGRRRPRPPVRRDRPRHHRDRRRHRDLHGLGRAWSGATPRVPSGS